MRYLLSAFLGILIYVGCHEILNLQEAQRYELCKYKTKNPNSCSEGASWLYKNFPEGPNLHLCVWPSQNQTMICKILGIKRTSNE